MVARLDEGAEVHPEYEPHVGYVRNASRRVRNEKEGEQ
jgi:hypothetical protein